MNARTLNRLIAAGATALALTTAQAATYDLQFTGTDISGSFVATTNAANVITSITGSFTDTDLSATPFTITGSSGYAAADNQLFGVPEYVTFSGISFTTNAGAGNAFNLFDNGGGMYYLLAESNDPGGTTYAGMPQVSLSVVAVPEPASIVLMLAGVVGLFGLARRRVAH